MTQHALDRIAERFPDRDPVEMFDAIVEATESGTVMAEHRDLVEGEYCLETWLQDGTVAFPVFTADGAIKTVLVEGMTYQTPAETITLARTVAALGCHADIDETRYHADHLRAEPTLSSTLARKLITQSPLHAWTAHPRLNPQWTPTTKVAFDVGKAAHAAILEARKNWRVYPEDVLGANGAASTRAAKAWEAETREAGYVPLKADQAQAVNAMRDKLLSETADRKIHFSPDHAEIVALAEIDGVTCRVMIDQAPPDPSLPLYDLKTCEDASPEACMRSVMNYGYDVQARHYLDVWAAATGEERKFRFVFQEKSPPHEVCVIELSALDLELAGQKTRRARDIWRMCLAQGHWPGYPKDVHVLDIPEFYHAKFTERNARHEAHRASTGRDVYARDFQAPIPTPENTVSAAEIFGG